MVCKQRGCAAALLILLLLFFLIFFAQVIKHGDNLKAAGAPESFKGGVKKCKTIGKGYTCLAEIGGRIYAVEAMQNAHSTVIHSLSSSGHGGTRINSPAAYAIKVIFPEDPTYEKLAVRFFE